MIALKNTFALLTALAATLVASAFEPNESHVYKTVGDTELELHVFTPPGHDSQDQRPAIVFFFGGGWNSGTPAQFYEQAQHLADLGMVAISADYRVKSRQGTSPFEAVADGKSAVRWIRQNAARLGIDPEQVIASGGSAGGHVAACTGVIAGYDEPGEDLSISSVPNAMVLFNPVIDTTEKGYGVSRVGEARKFEISPAHHVRPGIVPTLVFHGTADTTVPYENAERFARLMQEAGNDCELMPFEGKGHGFFNGKFFRPKSKDTSAYHQSMERTVSFLREYGYLPDANAPLSLRLASPFTDHMVLQRDQDLPVWGLAKPGSKVTVAFQQQRKTTQADARGKWILSLEPSPASAFLSSLTVSTDAPFEAIVVNDVLVGDVWICSGQSNMQMGAKGIPEIAALDFSEAPVRSFKVANAVAFEEQEFCEGNWASARPESAVAAAFAYYLEQHAGVPVGIIQTSWGSSSLEAWMPRDLTRSVPHFKTMMDEFDADSETKSRIQAILDGPRPWSRQDDVFLRRQSNILYNAMMAPLAPYACRGIVWYQGERNTQSVHGMIEEPWFSRNSGMLKYGDTLKKWIQRYRQEWQSDDLHFLIVMLPGYGKLLDPQPGQDELSPNAHSWAWMRESQLKALELPHTSVANTIDLGDVKNIHPKDKLPIGQRLALLAARDTLGQDIEAQGPTLQKSSRKGKQLVLTFEHAQGLTTTDGKAPAGFWIADKSGKWIQADARIEGETVVLSSPKVKQPRYVRYAFAGKPEVNLVNAAGLPAYPFRTDTFAP
ncbi:alpha/beta hydrolase fold domain-containing protein [Pelagicoccus sp. SDUM812005]|uniref:alpha/beta hydrolase fold domain-containing protein n=1 Tax=Pelagicoccus sp. SDUM812005 TaxID=3041257 RepID=UPI00280F0351|nr:alpha/beta hydrolase fold domain-containing protein [Pelagicoccus sp. SDUM812005]MDQ8181565.1 alpha/beta hydrolase fold domain-containing protein [Pelagicoccus sp. SDUM812005]